MAREVIILCDHCKSNGLRNSAKPHTLTIDQHKTRVLDLCDDCMQTLVGPVLSLLISDGIDLDKVSPSPAVRAPQTRTTRVSAPTQHKAKDDDPVRVEKLDRLGFPVTCLYCPKTLPSPARTLEHMVRYHNFDNALDVWGTLCPLCDKESPRLPMHVTTSHGIDMTEAIRRGAQRPEPENTIAKRLLTQRRRMHEVPDHRVTA
jgi:hypothetical protein